MSVDSIDFHPFEVNTVGEFNDLNSGAEYITEVVLGHKDAFPEFDKKAGSKQLQSFKHTVVKKCPVQPFIIAPRAFDVYTPFSIPLNESYSFLFFSEINPPPPKC